MRWILFMIGIGLFIMPIAMEANDILFIVLWFMSIIAIGMGALSK